MCHQRDIQIYVRHKSSFVFQDTLYRWENLNELFGKPNGKLGPQKRQIISPLLCYPISGCSSRRTLGLLSVLTSSFFKALSIILLPFLHLSLLTYLRNQNDLQLPPDFLLLVSVLSTPHGFSLKFSTPSK